MTTAHPTLEDHLRKLPHDLAVVLRRIAHAGRVIAHDVRLASVGDIVGATGETNVHGELVQKLDVTANRAMLQLVGATGEVCAMASEEEDDFVALDDGGLVVLFDPLDGSSNIDVGVSIGTIFGVQRRTSAAGRGTEADCLQVGTKQVAAGYVMYGSSTMLVLTTGDGVDAFTLDPRVGEFLLTHPRIQIPARGKTYSVNEGNQYVWHDPMRAWVAWLKDEDKATGRPYGLRYVGTLVADFHRTLLKGGVFSYPADMKSPHGKLRLLYEAAPLAMVAEQAGGAATNGSQRILELVPTGLHQRVPLYIGSKGDVEDALKRIQG